MIQAINSSNEARHDDVIRWTHFTRYWLFVRGIHRSPVEFPSKGAVTLSFSCFIRPVSEQTLQQTIETTMIWDAIVLIMTSHCNGTITPHIAKACCRTSVYSHFCVPPIPWHGKTISFAGALKSRHLPQRRISPSFDSIQNWRNRSVDMISNFCNCQQWRNKDIQSINQ